MESKLGTIVQTSVEISEKKNKNKNLKLKLPYDLATLYPDAYPKYTKSAHKASILIVTYSQKPRYGNRQMSMPINR